MQIGGCNGRKASVCSDLRIDMTHWLHYVDSLAQKSIDLNQRCVVTSTQRDGRETCIHEDFFCYA